MNDKYSWLRQGTKGLVCTPGKFVIDPIQPTDLAVITHGHADHARSGHRHIIATPETIAIMRARYKDIRKESTTPLDFGVAKKINDVEIRFASAGHILGSAQVVIDYRGTRVVVSGDYKRRADPSCEPFELVPCNLFITEATFGLPVFSHPPADTEVLKLLNSLKKFPDKTHLVGVYALGKCQRLLCHIRKHGYTEPIFIHGAMRPLCDLYKSFGYELGELIQVTSRVKKITAGKIVVCPPSAIAEKWSRGFVSPMTCLASGWMRIRQRVKQRQIELPLIISDHADWYELTTTVREVGAKDIWVTHGQEEALVHYAQTIGLNSAPLSLQT